MSFAKASRSRNPVVAAVLSVVGTPALAMLYLGRSRRSLIYFLLVVATVLISFQLARSGYWPAGVSWAWAYNVLLVVGAIDAWRIAAAYRRDFVGPWFTTWQGLTGIAATALVAVFGFRGTFFEPFRIPAASMLPTLAIGDHFFANKFVYGIRLPFTSIELTSGEAPARGDVIVFRPENSDIRYVKRIVGVPGDTVAIDPATQQLEINGTAVELDLIGGFGEESEAQLAVETIDERRHQLLLGATTATRGGVYRVPDGHYFVLGDNRSNSRDSRFPDIGMVPEQNIIGRANRIWWNTDAPDRAGTPL